MESDIVEVGLYEKLCADLRAHKRDQVHPLWALVILIFHRSLSVVFFYRLSAFFFARDTWPGTVLAKFFWRLNIMQSACDIDGRCSIGAGLKLAHPVGIVIGERVRMGRNVSIFQNVTVGVSHPARDEESKRYPVIGDNVSIYAGAVIIGDITIGDGACIGANAVVTRDVPSGHLAVGVPAQCRLLKGHS